LEIVIADNGVGLTPQETEDILKGIKASSNGTTGEQGYGFGLSLVKRLVDELNGQLSIVSEKGNGAQFTITLPQ
jgi:signal transduction histidine kinase